VEIILYCKRFLEWLGYKGKRLFFPGFDLHARCRYKFLPRFFLRGLIDTLDAGFGNGYLSYAAYLRGNRVLAIDKNPLLVDKAENFFKKIAIDRKRLIFQVYNLYDLGKIQRKFDQIICSETLEHIKEDRLIVSHFYNLLQPGGVLHLCCPYANHPLHKFGRIDRPEIHGHVRDVYTIESYRHLLEPIGFKIVASVGLGSPAITWIAENTRLLREKWGDLFFFPFFILSWPLQMLDRLDPPLPYSIYIKALKPAD